MHEFALSIVIRVSVGASILLETLETCHQLGGPIPHLSLHLHTLEVLHLNDYVLVCLKDIHELHDVGDAD